MHLYLIAPRSMIDWVQTEILLDLILVQKRICKVNVEWKEIVIGSVGISHLMTLLRLRLGIGLACYILTI